MTAALIVIGVIGLVVFLLLVVVGLAAVFASREGRPAVTFLGTRGWDRKAWKYRLAYLPGREIGYAVAATCDLDGCDEAIDRGLSYVCGGMHDGGEFGCGGYFCSRHLEYCFAPTSTPQLCPACMEELERSLVTCPDCQGSKQVEVYACPGFRRQLQDCRRCGATGEVTSAVAGRVAEGKRRAADRKARGLSLRQEAERLGITPMELADIEYARVRADA